MDKPRITIKGIARALNVSPSTMSRALKDDPDISRETHNLVHTYTRRHDYKPSVLAVNLHSNRSNTIGAIIPQLVHHFFSCVLSGIEMTTAGADCSIIMAQSNESCKQEVKTVQSFLTARVYGVVASLARNTEQYNHYQELLDNNVLIVFYDRICAGLKTERMVVDDYAESFAVVEYMIQIGCKRIFFYGADPHLGVTRSRHNGYLDAIGKYRTPVNDSMIKLCDSREHVIAVTPDLLESDNRPDGFFAVSDETAADVLYACKLVGLKAPGEVSAHGFIDRAVAQSIDPEPTTVEQHGGEVGKNAFSILADKLGGNEEKSTNRTVRTNLVVRRTTK